MTIVVGTAGHIDHGKTTLLRALTGIDADRLPEERRRGMTIDVGYAHLALDDGQAIDFVDVPGHDKLVGNMLVGAGEIDAVMLVVAADDGPRAQTIEHLALLDALGVGSGLAVVTKIDAVDPERVAAVVAAVADLLAPTSLAGSPVLAASGLTGEGVDAVRAATEALAAAHRAPARPPTLAIDRVFSVKGRGAVVTGTLRGGPLGRGDTLRLVPGDRDVRIREVQVHGGAVDRVEGGGRTALNLAGVEIGDLHRGMALTNDSLVRATDRALVAFGGLVADRTRARFHAGTADADASVGRAGRDALELPDGMPAGIVRLAVPVALAPGDRFVLRRGSARLPVGGVVLDVAPPRGISRRRQTAARVEMLAAAGRDPGARLALHGAIAEGGRTILAPDVRELAAAGALAVVRDEATLGQVRSAVAATLRRAVTIRRDEAVAVAGPVIEGLVADGRLVRDDDTLRHPGSAGRIVDPGLSAAMDRLEALLAVPAPPPLADAARVVNCSPDGVRALERAARIVVLEPDLAYAMTTYRDLAATALSMAARGPLTPAAYRDATGTSRKYVLAILEDLDRRAILRRTEGGHVPGPKAPPGRGRAVTGRVGAIVLAGGRSARFGRDKLTEPIDGRPLLDHAISAVQAVATDVVVVTAPGVEPMVPEGVRIAHDPVAFDGPLVGVVAGLAALDPGVERVMVVAGDMPSLVPAVLERLVGAIGSGHAAAVLGRGGDQQPLPLALDRRRGEAAARELVDGGERRLRALPEALAAHVVPEGSWRRDDAAAATLHDIDTPGDLEPA